MRTAYKFRLYPNKQQETMLDLTLETCRHLYNDALAARKKSWEAGEGIFSLPYNQQITCIKNKNQVYSQVLQNVLRRLDKSFLAAFGRVKTRKKQLEAKPAKKNPVKPGFPRFKSKNRYKSFTYPQSGFKIDGSRLTLSKIGSIRIFKHREVQGKIKTCTLKRDSTGCWYVILVTEIPDVPKKEGTLAIMAIGVDLGTVRQKDPGTGNMVGRLATLSIGQMVLYPRFFVKTEERLKVAHLSLARKLPGSKNREEARVKLAKIHKKIRNQRDDFLHKKTRKLVNLANLIIFERLQINGLSRGRNRSKDMHDHALRKFVQFTTYKAERAGGSVEFVNPQSTSKECSLCHKETKKYPGNRYPKCSNQECRLWINRDHNAAINILYRGLESRGIISQFDVLGHIYENEDGTLGLRDCACIDLVEYDLCAGSF